MEREMTIASEISIKCCACGAQGPEGHEVCERCGSARLLDRRKYFRRVLAVSIMILAVALLVAAMVYGEVHRAAGAVAIGI
jgi:predicted nucleic acid-binding Zn ribbon protein